MTARLPVFVYGTLRPGEGNYDWALAGCTTAEVPATVTGMILLDGPGFPYAVLSDDPADRVHGTLITIRPALHDDVLNRLDALEGVRPSGRGLYDRVTVQAVTDAAAIAVWTYVVPARRLATVFARHARIPNGDWSTR